MVRRYPWPVSVGCRLQHCRLAWTAVCRRPLPVMLGSQAVTACLRSLLVTWMLRGLAASWTGMVKVSTPTA